MTEHENKREYDRYPVSLKVQVSAFDEHGDHFTETGVVKDISGGGANLLTDQIDRYFIGQKLDLKIFLPGSEEINTDMHGHGMVVWIGEDPDRPDEIGAGSVGLSMNDLLAFEHLVKGA